MARCRMCGKSISRRTQKYLTCPNCGHWEKPDEKHTGFFSKVSQLFARSEQDRVQTQTIEVIIRRSSETE